MVEKFLTTNGYSQATIGQYRRVLSELTATFSDTACIQPGELLAWLDNHLWGDAMRWMAFSAVRAYLRWRYGADHPALALKIRRIKSGPQRVISPAKAGELINLLSTDNMIDKRDLSIVCLLLDTGLRESEICRLETNRLDMINRNLSVLCKGGEWGFAIYSRITAEAISAWLDTRHSIAAPGVRALFISLGGSTPGKALTPSGLRVIARRWGKLINCQISPHDFRRAFATIATKAKAPSRLVQMAGRWEHIEMVEHYTKSLELDDFRPYFPVDYVMNRDS